MNLSRAGARRCRRIDGTFHSGRLARPAAAARRRIAEAERAAGKHWGQEACSPEAIRQTDIKPIADIARLLLPLPQTLESFTRRGFTLTNRLAAAL